jgi:hypothetical protein
MTMPDLVKISERLWIWKDSWEIRAPSNSDTYGCGLGVPRGLPGERGNQDAYAALAAWLVAIGAKYICGPVLSGAQMAFATSLFSGGSLAPAYLGKEGYFPRKHGSELDIRGPYALIDDIVATGDSMWAAVRTLEAKTRSLPVAVVADYWNMDVLKRASWLTLKDLAWTVAKRTVER